MIYTKNWQADFLDLCKNCKHLIIVSPFVSMPILQKLKQVQSLKDVTLITRFNLQDFYSGVSDLNCLREIYDAQGEVFGVRGLHSKFYIFDKNKAIISSANLTNGGLRNNHECGILISDAHLIQELLNQIQKFKSIGSQLLNQTTIEDWEKELASVVHENTHKTSLPDYGSTDVELDDTKRYFVKFFGTSKNREGLDFTVREEVERGLCHYATCFSQSRRPRQFKDGDILFYGRMTWPSNYAIFGMAEAIKFDDQRDWASEAEVNERPWKEDWPVYLRVQNASFVDGVLGDCPMLYNLIDEFDFEAFPSTSYRYHNNGERNINPYKSLSQQPYIELTYNSARWLMERFVDAQNQTGIIPNSFIQKLPQAH